ncbi:MAG: Mrp/NBP35 family ATP-binding protein [Candidatus Omnitrophica bacterium]|nr:Mrp/NBP35 family ATP-binding protein [Candidatus Omnitrophota bacterium]
MSVVLTEQTVLEKLKEVEDPELGVDVITLKMVKEVRISGGSVSLTLELTTPACPVREKFQEEIRSAVASIPGVSKVDVTTTARVRATRPFDQQGMPGVKNVVAVASGKGGVGKSTVSANIAVALARSSARVGLMDADIYGPNIPLMMGLTGLPPLKDQRIVPAENFGVRVMSMGFLIGPEEAVVWRGPMLHGAVNKFLKEVLWGELDYLIVDLPPGTGDVQLSLAQSIPLSGALIVTTPQDVALQDVRRAISMFEKLKVPILGIVENMSSFFCPHCGKETEIFSKGGGQRAAESAGVPFLGKIPLLLDVRIGSDTGHPVVLTHPDSPASIALWETAQNLAAQLSILAQKEQERFKEVWKV